MQIEKPQILDASEPVSKAINELERTGLPVIVTKNGRYFGIIDERAIRQHANPSREKCGTIAEKTPVLSPDSTVLDACKAFFAGRFKAIPIISRGRIEGAVTRHTLLSELLAEKMLSKKRVSEVMTSPVASIDISATVGRARSELRKHNIRRLVVTQNGKLAGILSVFDLARAVSPKESYAFYRGGEKTSLDERPIVSYVKREVESVSESDSLASAVRKMLEAKVAALVVEEGGYPRGIVTAKDILHAALSEDKPAQVFVSGLPEENRDFAQQIVREGEKLLSRIGKSVKARSIAVHIKKEGSGFAVRAQLLARRTYNSSASDFVLEAAVSRVFEELRRMAERDKASGISKRRNRKEEGLE
ncbi:MAG: CBS domain-containing protein [Candidatus Micrarchaeota archaeon]|nr:CBS domain-containing protein [Candidatus Micrarchaeota archaeon]